MDVEYCVYLCVNKCVKKNWNLFSLKYHCNNLKKDQWTFQILNQPISICKRDAHKKVTLIKNWHWLKRTLIKKWCSLKKVMLIKKSDAH